ncbi:MAG TPA: vitamin K epoxide reductase family protein [Candidatus Udaeobacter sp.]|nr:vitamin K epoxide reductase family protein [Candidatus Udaeobacter sp.]
MERIAVAVLALLGLVLASYFTGVTYGWLAPNQRWMPPVCRLKEETCSRILDTSEARIFGLPNSVLGIGYYLALLGAAVAAPLPETLRTVLVAVAWGTVGLGAYLVYRLVWGLRVPCILCFTAHGLNLGLALLVTYGRSF